MLGVNCSPAGVGLGDEQDGLGDGLGLWDGLGLGDGLGDDPLGAEESHRFHC